jgi:hypothetical protein
MGENDKNLMRDVVIFCCGMKKKNLLTDSCRGAYFATGKAKRNS